jgi:HNH endonuclease/AP2 domain
MAVTIPLTCDQQAIIDTEFHAMVARCKWQAKWDSSTSAFRATRAECLQGKQKTIAMGRFIWQLAHGPIPDSMEIDHINGNPLDNQIANLRMVPHRVNMGNMRKHREGKTRSRYVGVTWHKRIEKWRARIYIHGHDHYLGAFDSEEKAGEAYQQALRNMEGDHLCRA